MISAQAVHARPGPLGDQVIEVVVDHGYRPHSIVAAAEMPLRLLFRRRDDDACMDRIVFSSPRLDRRLARGTTTTIVLPAHPAGEIRFTCGMGRYRGLIELRPQPSSSIDLRRAAAIGLRRAWRFIRGPGQSTVEQQAVAILGARFARGEISQLEFERARARALADDNKEPSAMSQHPDPTRSEHCPANADRRSTRHRARAAAFQAVQRRKAHVRFAAFGLFAVVVLGFGVYLAAGDLFGQRGAASTVDAIPVRMSMAGFSPADIRLPAGQAVALELWTTDAAPHLQNGVHTMISDELGIYEELPAAGATGESRRVVEFTTPATPGSYDIYCDTCCGGKDSPSMHGKLIVEA